MISSHDYLLSKGWTKDHSGWHSPKRSSGYTCDIYITGMPTEMAVEKQLQIDSDCLKFVLYNCKDEFVGKLGKVMLGI
jgi:hypothetical protein